MFIMQTLPAGSFDSCPRSARMLGERRPSWIFERMRLMSKDGEITLGDGVRSWILAPTLRLVDAVVVVAAVADLPARLLVRGCARREPPTRRDLRQKADADWGDDAAQPDRVDAGKAAGTGGEDTAETAAQTGCTKGVEATRLGARISSPVREAERSRSINGATVAVNADGLAGSDIGDWSWAAVGRSAHA